MNLIDWGSIEKIITAQAFQIKKKMDYNLKGSWKPFNDGQEILN